MLPLTFYLALTCGELRDTERAYAIRQVHLEDRLRRAGEPKWVLDALEREWLGIKAELDTVDDAKAAKGCMR